MAKCEIATEALVEVAAMLQSMGVSVVGSHAGNGVVALEIIGPSVPDCAVVRANIYLHQTAASSTLTATFEPA